MFLTNSLISHNSNEPHESFIYTDCAGKLLQRWGIYTQAHQRDKEKSSWLPVWIGSPPVKMFMPRRGFGLDV